MYFNTKWNKTGIKITCLYDLLFLQTKNLPDVWHTWGGLTKIASKLICDQLKLSNHVPLLLTWQSFVLLHRASGTSRNYISRCYCSELFSIIFVTSCIPTFLQNMYMLSDYRRLQYTEKVWYIPHYEAMSKLSSCRHQHFIPRGKFTGLSTNTFLCKKNSLAYVTWAPSKHLLTPDPNRV